MKTIIAGSRDITDYQLLLAAIKESGFTITHVVSGGARGVDALGERYANENKLPLTRIPADWEKYGKAAGALRNIQMAEESEGLVAVWNGSRGTQHMIQTATDLGLKVHVSRVSQSQTLEDMPRIPWKEE
jgi:hypothetical protein